MSFLLIAMLELLLQRLVMELLLDEEAAAIPGFKMWLRDIIAYKQRKAQTQYSLWLKINSNSKRLYIFT